MKIFNYKAINELETNIKKINIVYGQNGIGKTTLKDLLNKVALNLDITDNPNVDHLNEKSIVKIDEVVGMTPIIFDENYVREYVYNNYKLDGKNKYSILFSKEVLEKIKTNTKTVLILIEDSYKILDRIIRQLDNLFNLQNNYFDNKGLKAKLKNIIKPIIYNVEDLSVLNFLKEDDELYQWWFTGYQKYWDNEKTKCIFCNQDTASSELNSIFKAKINNKSSVNTKTQSDLVKELDNYNVLLSDKYALINNQFKKSIIDSTHKNVETDLNTLKDQLIPIKHVYEAISSKKQRISNYVNNFEKIDTADLELKNYSGIFNSDIENDIESYNENISKIREKISEYNETLKNNKETLNIMINENESLFNLILSNFNLSYKICIEENGLNLEKEELIYDFSLMNSEKTSEIQILEKTDEVLSYGEKNTLAFAFFIIDSINKLKNRVAGTRFLFILDDPISSHDIFRKYNTVDLIKKYIIDSLDDNDILILFTHEFELMLPMFQMVSNLDLSIKDKISILGMQSNKGNVDVVEIKRKNLTNSISRIRTYINDPIVNPISKVAMYRIVREFDSTISSITLNKDNLYNYFCEIIHSRASTENLDIEMYNDFIKKYRLKDCLLSKRSEYNNIFKSIDLDCVNQIDKYFLIRPYIEFMLSKENLKLDDNSYKNYSNKELINFYESNISYLNSSVHQNFNEDEPTIYDIKEFELFSSKVFDTFKNIVQSKDNTSVTFIHDTNIVDSDKIQSSEDKSNTIKEKIIKDEQTVPIKK